MNTLITNIAFVTGQLGHAVSADVLLAQTGRRDDNSLNYASLTDVLTSHQFDNQLLRIQPENIPVPAAPFILLLNNQESVVVHRITEDNHRRLYEISTPEGLQQTLTADDFRHHYSGFSWFIKRSLQAENRSGLPDQQLDKHSFRSIIRRFRPYYYQVILASFIINILALISSLYVMNVYDRVIPNQAYETLWVLSAGVVLAIAFEFMAKMLRGYLLDVAGKKADRIISALLFRRVMALRLDQKPASSGSYANNLRDFESVREFMTSATLLTLVDLPFVLLFTGVICMLGGYLALVPLTIIPVVIIAGILIQQPLARSINAGMKEGSQRQGMAVEAIDGIETLKVNNAAPRMQQRWEMLTAKTAASSVRARNLSNFMINFSAAMQQLNTVGLVFLGTYLIHAEDAGSRITMGALIASVILSGRALAPLGQIAGLATRFQSARMALQGVNAIINRPTEREEHKKYLTPGQVRGGLTFTGVTWRYSPESPVALDIAALSVSPGERIAILGKVGSGKSTLLRLLNGLYAQQQGSIALDGLDLRQTDPVWLRSKIALLSQKPRLFFGTLRENLDLARGDTPDNDNALTDALGRFRLSDLIRRHPAGLDMPLGEDGLGLSGGQKQLVSLTQLTLHQPQVVLLDEPTTGLDPDTEQQVIGALDTWTDKKTLIVVTHKYPVLALVDRIIVMEDGKILHDGPKETVLRHLKQAESAAEPARKPAAPQVKVVSRIVTRQGESA